MKTFIIDVGNMFIFINLFFFLNQFSRVVECLLKFVNTAPLYNTAHKDIE